MFEITNEDNMQLMARYKDNHFDLAIVDPPYGIGVTKNKRLNNNSKKEWDKEIPSRLFFKQLLRVSKNQIIWGGNYFIEHLENTRCFLNWDKLNHSNTYADCEMAWTSFDKNAKIFKYMWDGNRYGFPNSIQGVGKKSIRTHPTQKPVKLYEWLLTNYAEPNQKILDTHLGSGSIAIAIDNVNKVEKMNLTLTACELDADYYKSAMKRIDEQTKQLTIFNYE